MLSGMVLKQSYTDGLIALVKKKNDLMYKEASIFALTRLSCYYVLLCKYLRFLEPDVSKCGYWAILLAILRTTGVKFVAKSIPKQILVSRDAFFRCSAI